MEEVEINMVCIKLGIHGFWQPRSLISQKKKSSSKYILSFD